MTVPQTAGTSGPSGSSGSAASGRRPATDRRRRTPWDYRHVIANFADRDLRAQYKGTALGVLWSLLVPLATVITYSLVFTVVFRAEPPPFGNGNAGVFAVWFLVGLVAWNFFANSVSHGIAALVGAGPLMQKVYLPGFVPVLGTIGAVAVQLGIELAIVLVILTAFGNVAVTWLLLPVWLLLLIPFAAGVAVIAAVINIYVRDLGIVIGVVLQLMFFLTPVLYPLSVVPEQALGLPLRDIVAANPVAQFVMMLRQVLYDGVVPAAGQFALTAAWALAAVGGAALVLRRWGRGIGERI